jgi:hypothetical protein
VRTAILSVHSHSDRSFLDDRMLALISGDLRAAGIDNELVVALLDAAAEDPIATEAFGELARTLESCDVVIFERVWSRAPIEALRARLPDAVFVSCDGEHVLADPPADYACGGDLRASLPALLAHLVAEGSPLPKDTRARSDAGWREGLGKRGTRADEFAPNLRPIVIGASDASAWGRERTFSIEGNAGCPYRTDARDNPLYEGTTIPEAWGRGCAFCTTGNHSEAAAPVETAHKVMEQLRFVRRAAPEIERLVLKDQNPFGWLTEVVRSCVEEGLGGFSLLLETRVDWFLKNRRRFERALELAATAKIRLCPFLVGIESFSDEELARFNKGTSAADNELFLSLVDEWSARFPAFDTSHAAFGFVLLTPWTTMSDLAANLDAVERTRFDRWRGHLLVSRARLYPDTALYYLAERDGLLADAHVRADDDASRRYGYFPYTPWRFRDARVARFAELAATLTEAMGGRDQTRIWRALLDRLEAADDPAEVTADEVRAALREGPDIEAVRTRLNALLRPLSLAAPFEGAWRFGPLRVRPGCLSIRLEHDHERPVALDVVARTGEPQRGFARSRHYELLHHGHELTAAQERALRAVCEAIASNDR